MRMKLQLLMRPNGIHLPTAQGIAHEVVERGKDARKEEVWTFILINLQYNNVTYTVSHLRCVRTQIFFV